MSSNTASATASTATSANDSPKIPSLFIGYAHQTCSPEQVKEAFENALNKYDIVKGVDELVKTNKFGQNFKVFFIHFNRSSRQLDHMFDEINRHGFQVLTYQRDWDRRSAKYIDRYWKVFAYKAKPQTEHAPVSFIPRLMTRDEIEDLGIVAPKSVRETLPVEPEVIQAKNTPAQFEDGEIQDDDTPAKPKKVKADWPQLQTDPEDVSNIFKRLRFEDQVS